MPENIRSIKFPAFKIRQPVGEFFIGIIPSEQLYSIAYSDVRRIEAEKREVETYLGIERRLNPSRVKEIKEYVNTYDATFPTAIILAVKGSCAKWDEKHSTLTLSEFLPPHSKEEDENDEAIPFEKIAKILDGQHRIAGLEDYKGPPFELNVSVFIDADIAEQANIFATVNLAQTKVNRSLVYDLFELARSRSPQKTCHNVAVALDRHDKSPFYHRVKRLGVATEGRFNETITQATFVESLLRYLSRRPNEDRDLLLRGKELPQPTEAELKKLIFRGLFIEKRDEDISKIVWTYFSAVKGRWPIAWDNFERGNILNKTNGFRALMRFLRPTYLHLTRKTGEQVPAREFQGVLDTVKLDDSDFTVDNFPPGTSGEAALVRKLAEDTKLPPN